MTVSYRKKQSPEGPGAAPLRHLGDRQCLALARSGDRDAQAELVDRYLPVVFRLCLRLTGDRDSASDAAQEVFLRALSAIGRFETKTSFRAWVCTIAWNLIRDRGRRAAVRRVVSHEAGWETSFDPEDPRARTPLEIAAGKEKQALVARALDHLEPSLRAVLVLRDVEGFSYGELAALLGCRLGTVKSRVHRARLALKNALSALRPSLFNE